MEKKKIKKTKKVKKVRKQLSLKTISKSIREKYGLKPGMVTPFTGLKLTR